MTDRETLRLLELTSQNMDDYLASPDSKLRDVKASLKAKIAYLEKRAATSAPPEVLLSDDQASYYFRQSLLDLENSRLEGFEIQRLLEKMKGKGKEADNRELAEKLSGSMATNNQQWKLVTEFMGELFDQVMQRLAARDVS